jgi:hypothetical protein
MMNLSTFQINRFYEIFIPLLKFVNQKAKTLPEHVLKSLENSYNAQAASELRDVLWTNAWIIDKFVKENPNQMSPENLQTVRGWKNFRYGDFTVGKIIRGRGLFMAHDDPKDYYFVCPLMTPFDQLLPEIPIIVRTAIIQFENVLICDGLISSYAVSFGPGLRAMINEWYINAKELNTIRTSLNPSSPLTEREKQNQNEKTNKSVLRYFKKYSRDDGRSDKITDRDCETAKAFGTFLNSDPCGFTSLREITKENLFEYISTTRDLDKPTKIGLRRFFEYLADTERIDWELAEEILFIINNI